MIIENYSSCVAIETLIYHYVLVTQLWQTLCNPMDCCPPGFSVHEIFLANIPESVAISFSRGSSWPRDWTWVSCTAGRFFTNWTTREIHHSLLVEMQNDTNTLKVWQFHKTRYTNPEIVLLAICPNVLKIYIYTKAYKWMFITTL